jgi:hypothetical protein
MGRTHVRRWIGRVVSVRGDHRRNHYRFRVGHSAVGDRVYRSEAMGSVPRATESVSPDSPRQAPAHLRSDDRHVSPHRRVLRASPHRSTGQTKHVYLLPHRPIPDPGAAGNDRRWGLRLPRPPASATGRFLGGGRSRRRRSDGATRATSGNGAQVSLHCRCSSSRGW